MAAVLIRLQDSEAKALIPNRKERLPNAAKKGEVFDI